MSIRSFIARLNPLSGGPEEPPAEVDGVAMKEMGVHLSEFRSPVAFNHSPAVIHCGDCGETFVNYWAWYNHLGESFDGLDSARDWATVLVPEGFSLNAGDDPTETVSVNAEDIVDDLADGPDSGGKPSPKFDNGDDSDG